MLRAVPCVLLSVSLAMGGLVKQLHGLIARATAGERQAEDGGSRAVWQYRGMRCTSGSTTPDHIGPRGQPISSGAAVRCDCHWRPAHGAARSSM